MAALDRTGQGSFDTRLPTDGPAELARLGHAFNGMAGASTRPWRQRPPHPEQAVARAITERLEADRRAIARISTTSSARASPPSPPWPAPSSSAAPTPPDPPERRSDPRRGLAHAGRRARPAHPPAPPAAAPAKPSTTPCAATSPAGERHPDIELSTELFAGPQPLPDDITLATLRIVQESCTNIVRHALASRARVRLLREGGTLTVEISDNGRGILPAPGQAGFGLPACASGSSAWPAVSTSAAPGRRHASAPACPSPGRSRQPEPSPEDRPHDPARHPLTLILADDHAIVRMGFRLLLEGVGAHVLAEADSGEAAQQLMPNSTPTCW
jgi:hypothetical protein